MNGDKKISELLDNYKKPLKKLFKYDKSKQANIIIIKN